MSILDAYQTLPDRVLTSGFIDGKLEQHPFEPDTLVGVRLNLNVLKSTGVALQTLHKGSQRQYQAQTGFFNGKALDYRRCVYLHDAQMVVHPQARHEIFSGLKAKFPMASVDGKIQPLDTPLGLPLGFETGLPLRFNPKREHQFVDAQGYAVQKAEHAVVIGQTVYVWGKITYFTTENLPACNDPSTAKGKEPEQAHVVHRLAPHDIDPITTNSVRVAPRRG